MMAEFDFDMNYGRSELIKTGHESHDNQMRGELHPAPFKVFIDIYGSMKYLIKPGNMEFRGRRGIGKTMYFLSAHQRLLENFHNDKDIISAYVDLGNVISNLPGAAQSSPYFFVNQIYKNIFLSVLDNGFYPESDKRGGRDLNKLSEEKFILQRMGIRSRIEKLNNYLSGPGDRFTTRQEFEERNRIQNALKVRGGANIDAGLGGALPGFNTGFEAEENDAYRLDLTEAGAFEYKPVTVRMLLDEILKAFRAEHLIVFIDEFSTNHIARHFQPYLISKLIDTFDGNRFSIKFATIPGATTLNMSHPAYGQIGVQDDKRFSVFDFDDQAAIEPKILRSGNLHVFLKNLAFYYPSSYGKYIANTSDEEAQKAAFKQFIKDCFEDSQAYLEFEKAGEGLPRQLFDTYKQTLIRVRSRKLSRKDIWFAAYSDFLRKFGTELSQDRVCRRVLAQIKGAKSRIVKLEKAKDFIDAIERLTALGYIHACPVSSMVEKEISKYELEYYYTSYRTEVYHKLSQFATEPPQGFQIEDVTYILKSQHRELYQKANVVLLEDDKDDNTKKKRKN